VEQGSVNIWFMYDNHTFAKIGDPLVTPRAAMEAKARECFAEDGCGGLFTKDFAGLSIEGTRQPNGRYGVTDADLLAFFDRVDERVNWIARG
jgi:hypothetical protein